MSDPPVISNEPARELENDSQATKLINNRIAIFLMLFCVTGFLGIPFLCKSKAFTRTEKLVWSIVVTVYTCVLIAITVAIVKWSYTNISQALGW